MGAGCVAVDQAGGVVPDRTAKGVEGLGGENEGGERRVEGANVIHELKILPEYFEAVASGAKTFELRKDDREPCFCSLDILRLREWRKPVNNNGARYLEGVYTGREANRLVTYVLRDFHGLQPGYCILGFGHV